MKPGTRKQHASKKKASITIGRQGFAQISAIEGIRLTDEMWADFREFDHRRLSSNERRQAIARKYATPR
jgi:hypothetical protein